MYAVASSVTHYPDWCGTGIKSVKEDVRRGDGYVEASYQVGPAPQRLKKFRFDLRKHSTTNSRFDLRGNMSRLVLKTYLISSA